MNYKEKMKIKLMREAIQDFEKDFGRKPKTFFTKKDNFYFIVDYYDDMKTKFIHKKSLKMIYTNYDTYTYDLEPETCYLTKQYKPFDLCQLGLPEISKNFYAVTWLEGEIVMNISKEDFYHLKNKWNDKKFTPFYNQMLFNLIRNAEGIFIIDYKHFEYSKDLPFFIYFYNKDFNVNKLYCEKNIKKEDLEKIKKHLRKDYVVEDKNVVFR
jgi:hypothetical protein